MQASVFTTLYQDALPNSYGSLILSFRTLFDAGLAVYSYQSIDTKFLLIIHVFTMNVLLLNYLIAILSTTYENMQQSGIFKYKVNLYKYCERYMNAHKEGALGELVLHPPPLSAFAVLLIPFVVNKKLMRFTSKVFSLTMHWVENLIFLNAFLVYEFFMCPLTYFKVYINIIRASEGLFTKIFYVGMWLVFGILILC